MSKLDTLDNKTEIELQAAAFRVLRAHLQERVDVQNINLMTLPQLSIWLDTGRSQRKGHGHIQRRGTRLCLWYGLL
jgi:hypothetical protein